MNLKHLTNKTLLSDTKSLAAQYRALTTRLLHHLKEIERRRLFSDLGYGSMFEYVVKELGFSETSAIRRLHAARLLADIPEIESKIENGSLNLTNLSMALHVIRNEEIKDEETKKEIIRTIENSTKKQCEEKLKSFARDVPPPPKDLILRITISENCKTYVEDLKALLAHRKLSLADFYEVIFKTALEKFRKEKFCLTNKRETTSKNPRYVTAALKKAVYERDRVCQKCGSNYALEIDHRKPFALGGKTELSNLRLLCRSCNQRARLRAALGSASYRKDKGHRPLRNATKSAIEKGSAVRKRL